MSMHRLSLVDSQYINLNLMSLQCDNLSGELQDQWSSSYSDVVVLAYKTSLNTYNPLITETLNTILVIHVTACKYQSMKKIFPVSEKFL